MLIISFSDVGHVTDQVVEKTRKKIVITELRSSTLCTIGIANNNHK